MAKVIAVLGDGGSGKTTLITKLTENHPDRFRKVVTCTSRPIRPGEVEGQDYNFHPDNYFIDNPQLVLVKKAEGGHHYGTRLADLDARSHHLLITLRFVGLRRLMELGLPNLVAIHINVTRELKIQRMRERGDTAEMISGRLTFDDQDRGMADWSAFEVIELDASETLERKIAQVLGAC